MCVQESMLGAATPACPRGYALYAHSSPDQPGPGAGLITWFRNDVPRQEMVLNTTFEAKAYRIKLRKHITICNIYINQRQNLTMHNLQALFNQFPKYFAVLGDFNAKHP